MTLLVPMSPTVYAAYRGAAIVNYAKDNVESGRWLAEGSVARSEADFDALLPEGLKTPDHFLCEIRNNEGGPVLGFIWFAIVEKYGSRSVFVYDLEIKSAFRRQGHAVGAFKALERRVRELGLDTIGLHVFHHNLPAQALYEKLGYRVASINLMKVLDAKPG